MGFRVWGLGVRDYVGVKRGFLKLGVPFRGGCIYICMYIYTHIMGVYRV